MRYIFIIPSFRYFIYYYFIIYILLLFLIAVFENSRYIFSLDCFCLEVDKMIKKTRWSLTKTILDGTITIVGILNIWKALLACNIELRIKLKKESVAGSTAQENIFLLTVASLFPESFPSRSIKPKIENSSVLRSCAERKTEKAYYASLKLNMILIQIVFFVNYLTLDFELFFLFFNQVFSFSFFNSNSSHCKLIYLILCCRKISFF